MLPKGGATPSHHSTCADSRSDWEHCMRWEIGTSFKWCKTVIQVGHGSHLPE